MDTIVFGNFTVADMVIAAGVIIGLLYVLPMVKRLFKKKAPPSYAQAVTCSSCGWKGQVSMHAGKCPRCNQPLGDQRATYQQ